MKNIIVVMGVLGLVYHGAYIAFGDFGLLILLLSPIIVGAAYIIGAVIRSELQ